MSKSNQKSSQPRRHFSDEYKTEVVELVRTGDKSLGQVCKDLGLSESAVRRWVNDSKDKSLHISPSGDGESASEELKRLRSENKQLKAERDILKKATAFVCHEHG